MVPDRDDPEVETPVYHIISSEIRRSLTVRTSYSTDVGI
jgi:hypothetical protein